MATGEESMEELRRQLEYAKAEAARERSRAGSYLQEIKTLKEQSLTMHSRVEQEEEYITNQLMKRLERMSLEKKEMILKVEHEEEFLTNSLQKRLDQLTQEKAELESQLEAEQEYVVGDLQRKLQALSEEKAKLNEEKVQLERQLEAEQEYIMNKLTKQVDSLAAEKKTLRQEREDLRRQVDMLVAEKLRLHQEKVNLENQMETEEEAIVIRLQGQIQELARQKRHLERRLEAGSKTSESETSEDEGGFVWRSERLMYGASPFGSRSGRAHMGSGSGGGASWDMGYSGYGSRHGRVSSSGGRGTPRGSTTPQGVTSPRGSTRSTTPRSERDMSVSPGRRGGGGGSSGTLNQGSGSQVRTVPTPSRSGNLKGEVAFNATTKAT